MVMNISERKREIGVFGSQGTSRSQVVLMIVGEATVMGTTGLLLGIISGLLFYWGVTIVMNAYGFKVPVTIPLGSMRTPSFLAIGVSILSIIYPMHKASKFNIIDALRGK